MHPATHDASLVHAPVTVPAAPPEASQLEQPDPSLAWLFAHTRPSVSLDFLRIAALHGLDPNDLAGQIVTGYVHRQRQLARGLGRRRGDGAGR